MGRWGELAGQLTDDLDADDDLDTDAGVDAERPPSLEEFLESNHQLFTTIGVFGALSVYLMRFQRSMGEGTGGPVGAVLLLFLLTSFAAVRNAHRCSERAREHGAYLLTFGYAVFMCAFATLAVSVALVILGRYAGGAGNVLESSFVYALVVLYVPVVFGADALAAFEGSGPIAVAGRRSPHVAAVLLAGWYAVTFHRGGITPDLDSAAYSIGVVVSLVANHLVATAVVFGVAWVLDRTAARVRT